MASSDTERMQQETPPLPQGAMVVSRRRVIVGTGGVALISLVFGLLAAARITSPGEAAARARPPEASNITLPVEFQELHSEVVTRGDVVFEGATDLVVDVSTLGMPAVVTGQVPEEGATITAGAVILEVAGRPVVVLPGEVPAYRPLRPGMRGRDVSQLKSALNSLGLRGGDPDDDRFDATTASAVAALYERVGYLLPEPDESLEAESEAADETLEAAETALETAEAALAEAGKPASEVDRIQAGNAVAAAEQELSEARSAGDAARVAAAERDVSLAKASRDELLATPATTAEQAAVDAARGEVDRAQTEAEAARLAVGPWVPAQEVAFLPSLPRRVDEVYVERGQVLDGPAMRVSGADVLVNAVLSDGDASLVKVGMTAVIEGGAADVTGEVIEIRTDEGPDERTEPSGVDEGDDESGKRDAVRRTIAVIRPAGLTPQLIEDLRGTNVRVVIPVEATGGKVLTVPLAALTAGPGGESRVEVEDEPGQVRLVEVEVGLAAEGYAEVTSVNGLLEVGDLVVVGR